MAGAAASPNRRCRLWYLSSDGRCLDLAQLWNGSDRSRDGHQGDAQLFGVLVHQSLDVGRHGRGAFVQECVRWAVVAGRQRCRSRGCVTYKSLAMPICLVSRSVKETRTRCFSPPLEVSIGPSQIALRLRQDIFPLLPGLPATFTGGQVRQVYMLENVQEFLFGPASTLHLGVGVRASVSTSRGLLRELTRSPCVSVLL